MKRMCSMTKILVVEDEQHIMELIKFNLENKGYDVEAAFDGLSGLNKAKEYRPDLIILDIMLPELDGIKVCRYLKEDSITENIPVIMLTAKSLEDDKIKGLEMGADDYVTKPFSIRELLTRIKVILRRYSQTQDKGTEKIIFPDLSVDIEKREVVSEEQEISLTFKEFELLRLLVKNKGKVLSRDFLLDEIWGYDYYGDTRTVDVHIRHLRSKIKDGEKHKYIDTIRGVGYKFIDQ